MFGRAVSPSSTVYSPFTTVEVTALTPLLQSVLELLPFISENLNCPAPS